MRKFGNYHSIFSYKLYVLLLLTLFTVYSCSTSRHVTQLVERTSVDTLYLSSQHFDSVYVFRDRQLDRSRDTVYLSDVSVEYRYRLLRDTIYKVQQDSIPYEVRVVETKEIALPLTFFDRLYRACFYLLLGALLVLFLIFLFKLKTRIRL